MLDIFQHDFLNFIFIFQRYENFLAKSTKFLLADPPEWIWFLTRSREEKKVYQFKNNFLLFVERMRFSSFLCFIKRFQPKIKEEKLRLRLGSIWSEDEIDEENPENPHKSCCSSDKIAFLPLLSFFHLLLRNGKIPPLPIVFVSHLRISGFISNFPRLLNEWRKKFDLKLSFFSVEVYPNPSSIMPTWPPFRFDKKTMYFHFSLTLNSNCVTLKLRNDKSSHVSRDMNEDKKEKIIFIVQLRKINYMLE